MIFLNECRDFFRNRTNLVFNIVFPLALILLLGNMLTEQNYSDAEIGFIKMEYLLELDNPEEIAMAASFISNINQSGSVLMEQAVDKDEAKKKITEAKIDGLVVIKNNMIELFEGKDEIKNRTFATIINGYVQNKKVINVLSKNEGKSIYQEPRERNYTVKKDFQKNRSMLDYYGVCMIILIICFAGLGSFSGFGDEKANKTINRLIVSPMNRTKIYLQKVFGMMLNSALQISVIMLVSVLVFNVHYANNVIDNLLLFLLFLMTMMALGCIGVSMGLILKGNPLLIFGPLLWLMCAFSGVFSKEMLIERFSPYIPLYQILQAAFGLTVFSYRDKVFIILSIELVIATIFTIIGVMIFNRMQETR